MHNESLAFNFPTSEKTAKPILKWAGGKSQLIPNLVSLMPKKYGGYIEPFMGGGALFFHLAPKNAVIADSNPELINLYSQVALDVGPILKLLKKMPNDEEFFYKERKKTFSNLSPIQAAARTIYLNRTCFNGLYRVNKSGHFNVPFGRYKDPKVADEALLLMASSVLQGTKIIEGDYKDILRGYAKPGDFIFLDPPYLPISEYSDFKRYTKEQFYEDDHRELADEVKRLSDLGCHVLLTNSNHPLVHDLYSQYHIEVLTTRRSINSKATLRKGQDVIVAIAPRQRRIIKAAPLILPNQADRYPSTRFMGSKQKLLREISGVTSQLQFDNVVDLFSGSGVVGYMFKALGKKVVTNDHMAMSHCMTKAMVENSNVRLNLSDAALLLKAHSSHDRFVQKTFKGLYFSDQENRVIDSLRHNIKNLGNEYERAIAMAALVRACIKKRPRGIFTYTGDRYDDGRKDLKIPLQEHFLNAVEIINGAVFDNGKNNNAKLGDALNLKSLRNSLVYMDPPYYTPKSDNEYVRRYHFVEGLVRDWKGVEIQEHTQTKKFKSYPTPFSTRIGATDAFDRLFKRFSNSILLVSYSSNSLPTMDEMVGIMGKYKERVEVVPVNYRYSFGNQGHNVDSNRNRVQEFLFLGY